MSRDTVTNILFNCQVIQIWWKFSTLRAHIIQKISSHKQNMEIRKILKKGYIKFYEIFAQKQVNPPPLIFFFMFFYFHFFRHTHSQPTIYLLSVLPFTVFATLNFNFMYMTAQFIRLPNLIPASIIFFIALAVGCNDKQKTFIFLFNMGDALIKDLNFHSIYLLFTSGILSYEIYTCLICRTLSDNRQYFTGFFVIAIYGSIEFIDFNLSININTFQKIFLLIVAGLYAYHLFGLRIKEISRMNVDHIKDSRILAFYLSEFEELVRLQYIKQSKLSIHRRKCKRIHCFCHKESLIDENFFLRQLFQNSIKKNSSSCDTLLYEHYIDFLVKNQLMINALHFLAKWNHDSHYSFIAKLKCIYKIKKIFADIDSSNLYDKEYKYALQYDELLLNLTIKIYDVLELKLTFWHEVARQTPVMIKLQQNGLKIVDQMYDLNLFYNQVIKKYQKKLYSFDATILYAMYLLSTTNFQQYAELIIKNTSKVLEQIQVHESNSSETYAISIVVKQQGFYFMKDGPSELQSIENQQLMKKMEANQTRPFKFIINNSSNSFCKILKTSKQQLIGEELGYLIPNGYKQSHRQHIFKLLNFENQELDTIISSKRIHRNSKLPIKVGQSQLIMSYVSIKTMVDIQEGSVLISIIKKVNDKKINAMINFQGQLLQKEQGFNQEILLHSQFKKYIKITVDRWNKQRVVKQQRFNVMINSMNFGIIIYSPVSTKLSHITSGQLANDFPPLHVQIVNESSIKNKGFNVNNHENLVKQIKHMQNALNHDTESTSSSKNSNSAINILSTFSEKNSVPIYRHIIIGYIFVITCCLIVSMVGFLVFSLAWDTTDINSNNPLNDTINYLKLQHITNNVLLNVWDIQQFQSNPSLNGSEIIKYFNALSPYDLSMSSFFSSKFNQFKTYIYKCLRSPSSTLQSELVQRFNTVIKMKSNMSIFSSPVVIPQQNITFESLLMNYLDDINLLSRGINDERILLPITISYDIIALQNGSTFAPFIDSSIDSSLNKSLILAVCMNIIIGLLIIPMFFFLRSRLPIHEKVFDLFASIESSMVVTQIKSLTYASNIIKNYGQSSDILKNNVLQYQDNAIYPKGGSRMSFASNQIVIGLQKFDMAEAQQPSQSRFEQTKQNGTSKLMNFRKKSKRNSHITNYEEMKTYMEMKKTLQKRKRAGDLDFTGSQSDSHAKINKKHLIFYLMTIFFVLFLSLELLTIQSYGRQIQKRKDNIITIYQNYNTNQLAFLLAKLYLRNGNAGLARVSPMYGLTFLQGLVQSIPTYDYANYYGYDTVYQNCTVQSPTGQVTIKTVCMYNYSYLTITAEFGAALKQMFQARYTADQNYNSYVAKNQTSVYNQIITNISSKVFYLQSITNQLERLVYDIADNIYWDILLYSRSISNLKLGIFIASVCWWFATAFIGIVMLLDMKKQYFKQVYMLTFLNNQMLTNNKRVQSFLDSINKSSSN